jgi:hypothetical protein
LIATTLRGARDVGELAVDAVEPGAGLGVGAHDVAAAEHPDLAAALAREGLDLLDLPRGGVQPGEPGEGA